MCLDTGASDRIWPAPQEGEPRRYDDVCLFLVRLTLSLLSTCSSVCELSMICAVASAATRRESRIAAGGRRAQRRRRQRARARASRARVVRGARAGGGCEAHLGVGGLCLLDGLVVLVARGDLPRQVVVELGQALSEDAQVVLDLG
eukprot:6203794-Pleurochrysis_carterae.AAC.3